MTRFEKHPVLTLLAITLVAFIAFVALTEWALTPSDDRATVAGNDSSLRPDRVLKLREWQPDTRFAFGTVETRRANASEPVPDVYILETDRSGFIEPSVVHEQPDAEIVFVGGSTTECLYVLPENRFPSHAARLLEQHLDRKINGINAGKAGNNTMLSLLATIGKVLPRRPDFVVLMHATNDIGVLSRYGTYWNDSSDYALVLAPERSVEDAFRTLRDALVPYTYRRLRGALKSASVEPLVRRAAATETNEPDARSEALQQRARIGADFESALRSFVAVVRAWHSEPVLMTQVVVRNQENRERLQGEYLSKEALAAGNFTPESFGDTHDYFNGIIRHVALSEGVPLIDLAAARDWGEDDVYDRLHFTDSGSRRVAEVVADAMTPLLRARLAGR